VKRSIHKFTLLVGLSIIVLLSASVAALAAGFKDVSNTHWAKEDIQALVAKGVLTGYPDQTFRPNLPVTRAELAAILYKAAKIPAGSVSTSIHFEDVPQNKWYRDSVYAMSPFLEGYILNENSVFKPDQPATRVETVVALGRLLGYDADQSLSELATLKDWTEIPAAARPYISKALSEGVVSGYPDKTFQPNRQVTRAQAATMIWKTFERLQQNTAESDNTQSPFAGKWRNSELTDYDFTIVFLDQSVGLISYIIDGETVGGHFNYVKRSDTQIELTLLDDPSGPNMVFTLIDTTTLQLDYLGKQYRLSKQQS
jgi:hypothetical protein